MKSSWAAIVSAISLTLTACGSGGDSASLTGKKGAGLPSDLPLLDGAVMVNSSIGQGPNANSSAIFTTSQPAEATFEYYLSALEDAGFENPREGDVEGLLTATASRGTEMVVLTVTPQGDKTNVMVAIRGEQ